MTEITKKEALDYHSNTQPGKYKIQPTKPLNNKRDLSLAYSPGVAFPCLEIEKDPETSYQYTNRANTIAVISNGTAVLGLGSIGALASKPVMEGKSVLFKKFANIDSIDLELDTEDVDTFINTVQVLEPSFGGINLEDIKAPECFIIEEKLKQQMKIPVFHDDQHGTAIVAAAGLINACKIADKNLKDIKVVVNGAGASAIACSNLIVSLGVKKENILMCDSRGVIYTGRTDGMNQWKEKYANSTNLRTLTEAVNGSDVFLGLSVKGALSQDMLKSMAKNPIIFAMANPDPEITPKEAHQVRDDVIVATGRSDYPNQVNNVLAFPFIFRGALDVRATTINEDMKVAAAYAIADIAQKEVPKNIIETYKIENYHFGKNYIIPNPFDYRLAHAIPVAVAKAAILSKVAKAENFDFESYEKSLMNQFL